ncbi:glycosyltransferase family 25 protein [Roseicyclus persicicus]|uniref:Glycosyltransferase family 25 protein n=1 Tax=Roseicyclus persicicus TaxID=2650661 RepID=A0A7X6H010_9RHOB|nr:glycosyltransferase family 25 protein [Roseibacterium persicicum]NKX44723.1 glycosyltransferase family 25 protein [Roseibacterium persicicum]
MRALVINMGVATERMGVMAAQLDALGIAWERLEAVTPATLEPPEGDPVWHRWQRPMRVTEMALCASHVAAWRRVIALDAPCLVLEDDAVLSTRLPALLEAVAGLAEVEHLSLETRGRRKLVARAPHLAAPIRRLWQDRTGSAAYVVRPEGARKLIAAAARAGAPSDALISSAPGLRSWQADPALAVQLDICGRYGVPQAIPTKSLIDAVAKPPVAALTPAVRRAYRARRIAAQLAMGGRLVRHALDGTRREVQPEGPWVDLSAR